MDKKEIVRRLREFADVAYNWRLADLVCGVPYDEFEFIMNEAADMIEAEN